MIGYSILIVCLASLHGAMANSNAALDITTTGNIDLSNVQVEQQFFYSAEEGQLVLKVTATQGGITVFTRDGGQVVDLGDATPGQPLQVNGSYDNLYIKQDDGEQQDGKGTYELAFPEPLSMLQPAGRVPEAGSPSIIMAAMTSLLIQPEPEPEVPTFALLPNDGQQIFQGDGTTCTMITVNVAAGSGIVTCTPTYDDDDGPRDGVPVGGGNSVTFKCKLTALVLTTGNQSASGTYEVE